MIYREPGNPLRRTLRPARAESIDLRKRRTWYEGEGDTETDTTQDKSGQSTGATLTQEEVNRLVGKTRKEARETGIHEFLKELGFEKPDDLKSLVEAAKQRDDAEKSELEKAQQRIAALEKAAQDAKSAAEKAQQERLEERRNAAILAALKDAEKPQSVLTLLLNEHASDVQAVMEDDGTVDPKKVAALADTAKKDYAGMFARPSTPGSQSNAGGRNPTPSNKELLDRVVGKVRL